MSIMNPKSPVANAPESFSRKVEEKPQNGLAGLKHWKDDLFAGLIVSFVAIPVSIGIAIASGAPPIAGLISVMVSGFVAVFLGGTHITISGPAAGLAPAIYGAIIALGHGNTDIGYPLLLPLITIVGLVQVILSRLKVAEFSKGFPLPVVEGMLSAIGIMIIAKMLPLLIGHKYQAHDFWGMIAETPHEILNAHAGVFVLGLGCLALVFALMSAAKRIPALKYVPPQLVVVLVGTVIAISMHFEPTYLIAIPENIAKGVVYPDFSQFFHRPDLWMTALSIIVTLTVIDGIESLSTITAVDKIDPYKRKSEPNQTLFAMGVSNVCSSLFGGLTIIPEIVRSTTCVLAKGKTLWANFYMSIFVILFVGLLRDYISQIPLTALAAVVIYTGYSICKPSIWIRMFKIGKEQFFLFAWTIFVTLSTDLMLGIISGTVLAVLINYFYIAKSAKQNNSDRSAVALAVNMFRSPVYDIHNQDSECHIYLDKPLVSTNMVFLIKVLSNLPEKADRIYLHLTRQVLMVDHSTADNLFEFVNTYNEHSATRKIELVGIEKFRALTGSEHATHLLDIELEQLSA